MKSRSATLLFRQKVAPVCLIASVTNIQPGTTSVEMWAFRKQFLLDVTEFGRGHGKKLKKGAIVIAYGFHVKENQQNWCFLFSSWRALAAKNLRCFESEQLQAEKNLFIVAFTR